MSTKRPKKRCQYCRRIFHPDQRVGKQQKACGQAACRKARKEQAQRKWTKKNPEYFKDRYENTGQWLKDHPGYLQSYRKSHSLYVQKNRDKQKQRRSRRSGGDRCQTGRVDIQDTIITQPVDKIEVKSRLVGVDIQDAITPQVVVPVYVNDALGDVDIQDNIGRGPFDRYTSMRIITRKRLKQFMRGYQHAGR